MRTPLKAVRYAALVAVCVLSALTRCSAQAAFTNLDFENGTYIPLGSPYDIATTNALPGWTAYIGGSPVQSVWYNNVSLGGAAISWHGPPGIGYPYAPYRGQYCVLLQQACCNIGTTVAVGQTAQIPANARSLTYYLYNGIVQVTFSGQPVTTYDLGGVSGLHSYHRWSADISSFAGQTGELRFTAGGGVLDLIQFSSEATQVPAPLLQIQKSTNSVTISWPDDRNTWVLESTTQLNLSNSWNAIATNLPYALRQVVVEDAAMSTNRFYRLRFQ